MKLKNIEKMGLKKNEFYLLTDISNGCIPDVTFLNCKSEFMDRIFDFDKFGVNREYFDKHKVNRDLLYITLFNFSYSQILELLIEIDNFWEIDEDLYLSIKCKSPKQALVDYHHQQHEID